MNAARVERRTVTATPERRVLIVDDDPDFVEALTEFLSLRGLTIQAANTGDKACEIAEAFRPDVALLDVRLGEDNGLDVLASLRRERPEILCVMITAYADVDTAIQAVRQGAYDFLKKPFQNDELLSVLDRCFDKLELERAKAAAEQALHDSRTQLMDAIESISEGFILYDADERFVLSNSKYRDFYPQIDDELVPGAKLEDVARTAFERGAVQGAAENVDKWLRIRLEQNRTARGTHEQQLSDGRWLLCTERKMTGGGTVGIRTDITDLKSREQALHEREQHMRGILDNVADGVITIDAEGTIESFNPAAARLLGYEAGEVLGRNVRMLMPEPDRGRHDGYLGNYLATGEGKILGVGAREVMARRKDGSTFPMELSVGEMRLGERRVFIGAMRDISKRKRAEEALRQSEEKFRALIENTTDLITVLDGNGKIRFQSASIERVLGYTPDELLGKSAFELVHPDDLGEGSKLFSRMASGPGRTVSAEYRVRHKDGSWRTLESRAQNALDEPTVNGIIVNSRDVTERKRAERALRQSQSSLANAQRIARVGNWDWDVASDRLRWSDEVFRIFGRDPESFEVTNETFLACIHPDDRSKARQPIDGALRGINSYSLDYRVVRPDGVERIVHEQGEVKLDDSGKPIRTSGTVQDITERKRVEEALRESERRAADAHALLLDAIESSPDGIVLYDADDKLVVCNDRFRDVLSGIRDLIVPGVKFEDLVRAAVDRDLVHVPDGDVEGYVRARLEHHGNSGGDLEARFVNDRWMLSRERRLQSGGIIGTRTDITAFKRAQEALSDSKDRLANAQRIAALGSYDWDPVGDHLAWSDETYRIMGRKPEEFHPTFQSFLECVHPDDRALFEETLAAAMNEKRSYEAEFRIVRPGGEVRVIRDQGEVVLGQGGEIVRVRGAIHDITERKRADRAEARFREAIETLSEGFALFDAEDRLVLCNGKYRELFPLLADLIQPGVGFEELVRAAAERGQNVDALGDPEGWVQRRLEPHGKAGGTFEHQMADGRWLWVIDHKAPDGYTMSTYIDITERRQAEEALRDSETRLAKAQRIAQLGSWNWDIAGDRLNWSGEVFRIFGLEPESFETSNETFLECIHPDDRPRVREAIDEAVAGKRPYSLDFRVRRPGGGERYVHEQGEVTFDDDGQPIRMSGTIQDITERKRLEEQYSQAQKMEAVGQLTGGVAHDFNNLLTVILGNLELLDEELGDNDELRSLAFAAQNAGLRGAELTRRLLAFSRKQALEPKVIDLDRLVLDMSGLLRRTLGQTIEIQTVTTAGLWPTLADPAQVENALLNLAINARDAMPEGGKLTIETLNAGQADEHVAKRADLEPGDYVTLRVSDTGVGMSPEALERAVEPFFTTKEAGKGSGLGLSMVYGFARQSGGDLAIDSAPDRGTRVTLYLPKADVVDGDEAAQAAEPRSCPGGDETVLVVEDDVEVRALAVKIFTGLGYEVIEAESGPVALEILEGDAEVDLLFSDVLMPGGMSGWRLARKALRHRPGLKVLLCSGYPQDFVADHDLPEQGVELLPKPYAKTDVARKVRSVLDGDAAQFENGRRLLVVDDDPDVGDFVRRVAEGHGYEVKVTARPEAFKAIYEAFRPAVIVMDIVMPEVDGIELLRYLAAQGCRSRVVVMSGYNESYLRNAQSIGEGLGLGDVAGLAKPLRVETLRSALQGPA